MFNLMQKLFDPSFDIHTRNNNLYIILECWHTAIVAVQYNDLFNACEGTN